MSLREFDERFPDEAACWAYLRKHRWGEDSFECPACGETEHWGLIQTRRLFECYECGKQTSMTADTILATPNWTCKPGCWPPTSPDHEEEHQHAGTCA